MAVNCMRVCNNHDVLGHPSVLVFSTKAELHKINKSGRIPDTNSPIEKGDILLHQLEL